MLAGLLAYSLTVVMLVSGMFGDVGMGHNVQVTTTRGSEIHACVTGSTSQCTVQVNAGTHIVKAKPGPGYPTPWGFHWNCDQASVSVTANKAITLHCRLYPGF